MCISWDVAALGGNSICCQCFFMLHACLTIHMVCVIICFWHYMMFMLINWIKCSLRHFCLYFNMDVTNTKYVKVRQKLKQSTKIWELREKYKKNKTKKTHNILCRKPMFILFYHLVTPTNVFLRLLLGLWHQVHWWSSGPLLYQKLHRNSSSEKCEETFQEIISFNWDLI